MTISGTGSIIGWAPQAEFLGVEADTFDPSGLTFYRTRAPTIGMGMQGPVTPFEWETGGPTTPSGTFKTMQFGGGNIDMFPRCEDVLGWLLYAATGAVSSAAYSGVTDAYKHSFTFHTDGLTLPWMAFRKYVPGGQPLGEEFWDGIVSALRIVLPQMGPAALTAMITARGARFADPTGWTWGNVSEDTKSVPMAGLSGVFLAGERLPTINAVVDLANNTTTPQDEMAHGSYHPDSFTSLNRSFSVRFIYKYNNSEMYRRMHTGSIAGTDWSAGPTVIETVGATKAFRLPLTAPYNIPGSDPLTPYGLELWSDRVEMIPGNVLEVSANQMITQEFTLLSTDAADPSKDYVMFDLINGVSGYTWPTP